MTRLRATLLLSLAASLLVGPAAMAQNTTSARPGTINYVEGQAALNGAPIGARAANTEIAKGQTLSTRDGKAEVLLTPGVFLRVGENSAVTMVSPDLTNTEIQLDRGTAEVEVDQIYKQNHLLVDQGPAQTELLKKGLYEFDGNADQVRVFDGEAAVSPSQKSQKWIKVKSHHDLALHGEALKAQSFDPEQVASHDPLYAWSKLRADYLGQANEAMAQEYAGASGFYPGWQWDPWLYEYTWLPGDGLFWSPFGYGFYSPAYLYGGGFIYGTPVFRGSYRGHYFPRGGAGFHGRTAPTGHGFSGGAFHGAPAGGGFHGGGHFGGGGFHGGGRR